MQCRSGLHTKGMYNGVPFVVSRLPFLQKPPSNALETVIPSPREGTARACAPRLNRGLKQRCRSHLIVDDGCGSRTGARKI